MLAVARPQRYARRMAIIEVELGGSDATGQARAEVTWLDTRKRILFGSAVGVAGTLVGGLSILAPGLHLVLGWLAPVIGVGLGLATGSLTAWVHRVTGPCPTCSQPLETPGPGPVWTLAATVRCPHCGSALDVRLPR